MQNHTGAIYEGWRKKSKRHGYGRIIEATGIIYQGEWKNNLPHGKGTIFYPNGSIFQGTFKKSKRNLQGKFNFINYFSGHLRVPTQKKTYFGYYMNDQMHGYFTIFT